MVLKRHFTIGLRKMEIRDSENTVVYYSTLIARGGSFLIFKLRPDWNCSFFVVWSLKEDPCLFALSVEKKKRSRKLIIVISLSEFIGKKKCDSSALFVKKAAEGSPTHNVIRGLKTVKVTLQHLRAYITYQINLKIGSYITRYKEINFIL